MKVDIAAPTTVRLVLALVIVLAGFRYVHDIVKLAVEAPTVDFATHYGFTAALWAGMNPFRPDGLAWVDTMLGVRRAGTPGTVPPGGYLVFLPLLLVPYAIARLVWLAIGQACFAAMLVVLRRRLVSGELLAVCGVFVALSFQPLYEDVALGNVNVEVACLLAIAMLAHANGKVVATALPLSLAVMLKLPYAALIPYLWWLGTPGTAALTLALAAGWCGLAFAVFGTAWVGDYWAFLSVGSAPLHAWPRNLSPHAVLHRVTGMLEPNVWVDALAIVLALAVVTAVLVLTRDARADVEGRLGGWMLALAALPLASPLAEENHFVVQLIPLLFVLTRALDFRTTAERVMVLVGILLLASRYSLEGFTALSTGIPALAQTGKIAGIAVLTVLTARLVRRRSVA